MNKPLAAAVIVTLTVLDSASFHRLCADLSKENPEEIRAILTELETKGYVSKTSEGDYWLVNHKLVIDLAARGFDALDSDS